MNHQVQGTFTCTMELSCYTTAEAFSSRGLNTRLTVFTNGFYPPDSVTNPMIDDIFDDMLDDIIEDEDLDLCFHSRRGKLNISIRHNAIDRGDQETRHAGLLPQASDRGDLVTNSNGDRFYIRWFLLSRRMGHQQSYDRRYWRLMAQVTPARALDDAASQGIPACDVVETAEVLVLEVGHITLDHSMDHVSADFDVGTYARNDHHRIDAELTAHGKNNHGDTHMAPKRRRSAALAACGITTVHTHCL